MRSLLLTTVLLLLPLTMRAQEPKVETLHVTSSLVEVSAVVTDKTGEPRVGLTKDDFILKQDGKEQAIRYFSQGEALPLTFVVMIDTSGSQRTFIDDEQRACEVFFETVLGRPQDHALLVQVDNEVVARSNLTTSTQELHLGLLSLRVNPKETTRTRLYDAIHAISQQVLAKEHGRKAIILLSDGGENGSEASREEAIGEAQRDNVPVYSVVFSAWSGLSNDYQGQQQRGLDNLNSWAAQTGGRVYQPGPSITLRSIFANIAAELRSQYEIGYNLPPDTRPKQFHKLEVKTRDKSLRVQARKGFYTNP